MEKVTKEEYIKMYKKMVEQVFNDGTFIHDEESLSKYEKMLEDIDTNPDKYYQVYLNEYNEKQE